MPQFLNFFIVYGQSILMLLLNPILWLLFFLLFVPLSKSKNHLRHDKKEQNKILKRSITLSLLLGIVGGFFLLLLGINVVESTGFYWVLPLSLLFSLIKSRWVCFSYGTGILLLLQSFLPLGSFGSESLLFITGILHILEGFLVFFDGHSNIKPLYIRRNNEVVGAFQLEKTWMIPLCTLFVEGLLLHSIFPMPHWWVPQTMMDAYTGNIYLTMLFSVGALTFRFQTTSLALKKETRRISMYLIGYGIIVILFGKILQNYEFLLPFAGLFVILGHEGILWLGRGHQNQKAMQNGSSGIGILWVEKESLADHLGLKSGDYLVECNGLMLYQKKDFDKSIQRNTEEVVLVIKDHNGKERMVTVDKINAFGAFFAPDADDFVQSVDMQDGLLLSWFKTRRRLLNER